MEGENGKFHHFGGHLGVHPIWGSDAALKSRGNLCFFEDVGVEGFFAF
jgi:hypothetical protein